MEQRQTIKAAYKEHMYKQHTSKIVDLAKEEINLTGKFARKVSRNLIKKKMWDERESKKKTSTH